MPKQTDERDDDQAAAEQPAAVPPSIEDSAVRAAREAKENDDLPDPDTDTKEHEDRAGKRSK